MDEQRAQKPDGKVVRFDNLRFPIIRRQSSDYRLVECDGSSSRTGHLPVFHLMPLASSLPCFEARWDGGSIAPGKFERSDLDIDLIDPDTRKRAKSGFVGHRSCETTDAASHHRYNVLIKLPDGMVVLDATCTFTVQRTISGLFAGNGSMTADPHVVHG
jgi:hypothetical protein